MSPHRDPWTWLSRATVYDNPWIKVEERRGLNPAGAPALYGVVRLKRLAVGVLPLEADGSVHLVGQWRVPLERYSWEMPEGGADPGEAPEACARRELAEETGLSAGRLVEILRMDLSNSVTDEQAVLFLATELTAGVACPEETEVLAHKRVSFRQALDEVLAGRITDSLTVAALLRAHHMAVTGGVPPALARALLG